MLSLKVKCEVVTPLFMSGAGREPELRPSEFKGMMRFWWRAIKAEDNIEKLRKEEAEIFGGTGEGQGMSKVSVTINNHQPSNAYVGKNVLDEIEGKNGCKYLLYSTFALKVKGKRLIKEYIKSRYSFITHLKAQDEDSYRKSIAVFWISIYLGGFGSRARRGGGNIIVKQVLEVDSTEINFICDVKNVDELGIWLENNIKKIKEVVKQSNVGTNKYTNMEGGRILLFEAKKSWAEALNFIGEIFRDFRGKNKGKIFETAAFGMPVMHSKFTIRMVPYKKNKILSDRWASPLIFKVIKSGDLYFPIIVKLSAGGIQFIGKERKERGKWELDDMSIQEFNEQLVNEFLDSLPKRKELVL